MFRILQEWSFSMDHVILWCGFKCKAVHRFEVACPTTFVAPGWGGLITWNVEHLQRKVRFYHLFSHYSFIVHFYCGQPISAWNTFSQFNHTQKSFSGPWPFFFFLFKVLFTLANDICRAPLKTKCSYSERSDFSLQRTPPQQTNLQTASAKELRM